MAAQTVLHYRILNKLGAGGMGEVYLAEDTRLERRVALKVLPEEFTRSEDRLRRFVQEAKTASALNHPNIIIIHEIGQTDSTHYIATEFVEGVTLRQHLARGRMTINGALELGVQIASALQAAHKAAIIHRDIKPENIMLREDGLVKVLDFGLAKLVEAPPATTDTSAPTVAKALTEPGVVMGTISYMSPEQARGLPLDARSDIFSFGVVLYEMIAGRKPFQGETASDVIASLLVIEPVPISQLAPDVPPALQHIIGKALRKDRDERYQTVKSLLADLKTLKQEIEFESRLKSGSAARAISAGPHGPLQTELDAATQTVEAKTSADVVAGTTTSPVSIVSHIKSHRRGMIVAIAALVILFIAAFFYLNRAPVLTNKDTILLTDFVNTTGDAVFDGTLRQGLAVQLGQSPFLNIFPEAQARQTLRLMGRAPDERVTADVGREICQRQGLKALIVGSIAPLGNHYAITLEAISAQTGEAVGREQVEAEGKEQVLRALGQAATSLREKLGESLSSIQNFDAPIEQATTHSLDALKAYSLGLEQSYQGNYANAIPFHTRAIELDPNFALAYQALAREQLNTDYSDSVIEAATKAFELRERTTENEKFQISSFYHLSVTYDLDKAIEVGELWKRTYPNYWRPYHALSDLYLTTAQYAKSVEAGREAVRLNPNVAAAYSNLAGSLVFLNRFAEAKEAYNQAMARGLDAPEYHYFLFWIAYVEGDEQGMQQQLDYFRSSSQPYWEPRLKSQAAVLRGRFREAQALSRLATEIAESKGLRGFASWNVFGDALRYAALGDCRIVKENMPALSSNAHTENQARAAIALALCGETGQAQAIAARLSQRFPKDTMLNGVWLPAIRAAVELQRGDAQQAIEELRPALRYDGTADLWPTYLRGLARLRRGEGAEALTEFQKFLDYKGRCTWSPLNSLAHLWVARAAVVKGDAAKARKAYEDFLTLWKDADPETPILKEAEKEYEKLKSS